MSNQLDLSSLTRSECVITTAVIHGTEATIREVKNQGENHASEIADIVVRLNSLENKVLCNSDLDTFEQKLKLSVESILNSKIDKLEDNFKTYIKENVAMKSDLHKITKDTIDWVNQNSATKQDILKLENTLLWKLVGFIGAIVAATAYIIKG